MYKAVSKYQATSARVTLFVNKTNLTTKPTPVLFQKSALIGAKQSISTPGSKQTQLCKISGSI